MGILKNFEGDGHENEHVNAISHIDTLVNTNHLNASPSSSEDEETHESTFVPAPPTITVVPLTTSNRTPKIKKSTSKIPKPILQIKNIGSKKSQGHRQARRHENMCFLLNLAKDLDEDFAEVNINDLVETTISAFAQLLLSKNKMKIWNEFIELPESQQEHIVKMATNKKKARKFRQEKNKQRFNNDSTSISCSSDDNFETFVLIENHTTMNNNESIHPLHQQEEADKCFRRIDPNIRYTLKSMLKRHHLPLMNAPATFESFLLLDGEKKIIVEKDTKVPNAVVFTISKEDHTLANMLRAQLLKDPEVIFTGYKIPHPLEHKVILRVQTAGHEYSPINAMENAIKDLIFEMDMLEDRVKQAIANRQNAE
ncbi:unnamed protein product [Rotaria sp. Silwood2]|nr:unnamed protein product [Rotaria sp. Silwood2]CAF4030868.1 unnamed protein product [Rotaria sp. Silwood2]CAF4061209.1 unnamed protein product [Rotaria sp. Silwood2]CAF4075755.1 unnamed protein product [Rotaria sp. Silwood2]